ncbi:MAG: hypothetical protein WC655_29760 [Candidatus Hydrogenedentales bacterium]|jgi:hypothetical protein
MTKLEPGDLIGFSAHDLLGAAINVSTLGWPLPPVCWRGLTHVAIVGLDSGCQPVLWESTSLCDLPCLYCGSIHSGVQSHGPWTRIRNYAGSVWHYPLREPLGTFDTVRLRIFSERHHATPYDPLGAAQSRSLCFGWLHRLWLPESGHKLFCSEYIAAAWEAATVWDTPNISAWSPNRLARIAVAAGIVLEPRRLK